MGEVCQWVAVESICDRQTRTRRRRAEQARVGECQVTDRVPGNRRVGGARDPGPATRVDVPDDTIRYHCANHPRPAPTLAPVGSQSCGDADRLRRGQYYPAGESGMVESEMER